jgi:F-type H+-transporting ATPase subunit delta
MNKMIEEKIATPYAAAFLELGIKTFIGNQNSDAFYKLLYDAQDLLNVLKASPELKAFLTNPLTTVDAKKAILKKCLNETASPNTVNFLNLLVDKQRVVYLESILTKFLAKAYEFLCVKFVEVTSAVDLTAEQEAQLEEKLKVLIGPMFAGTENQSAKVKLTKIVDPTIIGGLIVKIDSKVIDLSLRGEVKQLAKNLNVSI